MKHKVLKLLRTRLNELQFISSVLLIIVFVSVLPALGQTQTAPANKAIKKPSLERRFLKNIIEDQGRIWTSPFRLRTSDANWLVPLTAATAGLIATDRKTAGSLSNNQSRINLSLDVSRFGSFYTTGGTALTFYAVGKITDNQKAKETGLLAGEALINTGIVVEAIKFATQRPRPLKKQGHGNFFTGGNTFPSGHSASAWALATVISREYGKNHPLIKYGAYGLATAVGLSRYTARRHFLSDVLVGSAIGYAIGNFTYLRHHDTSLDSPGGIKKTTKLEKYFPAIAPQYDARSKSYGAALAWNF